MVSKRSITSFEDRRSIMVAKMEVPNNGVSVKYVTRLVEERLVMVQITGLSLTSNPPS